MVAEEKKNSSIRTELFGIVGILAALALRNSIFLNPDVAVLRGHLFTSQP
jgi:hypothetical protein